jgi:hypothetical protein
MNRRNHILYFLSIILFAFISAGCGSRKSKINLNDKDALIYEVNFANNPVEMLVEIEARKPDLVLKYRMGFEEPRVGEITISSQALKDSYEQDNFWIGDKLISNKTTLWVSSAAYLDIVESGEVKMPFRQGFTYHDLTYRLVDKTELELVFNGKLKKFHTFYLEDTEGKGFKYWIWNNQTDPLILKMDLGWQLTLKEIIHL